eukprot:1219070-Alexandrium_andersonii.AAC.1
MGSPSQPPRSPPPSTTALGRPLRASSVHSALLAPPLPSAMLPPTEAMDLAWRTTTCSRRRA